MTFVSIETATAGSIEVALDEAMKAVAARNSMQLWRISPRGAGKEFVSKTAQRYIDCGRRGMTRKEAAEHLGVSYQTVCQMARKYNIEFVSDRMGWKK